MSFFFSLSLFFLPSLEDYSMASSKEFSVNEKLEYSCPYRRVVLQAGMFHL